MAEVVWQRPAFDAMDRIIRDNPDRRPEIAAALRRVAILLALDPARAGESRDRPYRVLIARPLTVWFRHTPDRRVVFVVRARLRPRPPRRG